MRPTTRHPSRRPRPDAEAGFTLVEVMVSMSLVAIAVGVLATTVVATSRQRAIHGENERAVLAAHALFERMRNEPFEELFARYNPEPFDDPAGPGTAPGPLFAVQGLRPLPRAEDGPQAEDGMVGQVILPSVNTGGNIDASWELREDLEFAPLGMPRDLDGDSVIDGEDHAGDYAVLPVMARITWAGPFGPRELSLHTVLVDWGSAR